MELSVVIVNWNTRELLAQCLHSLIHSLILKDYEIFVVDNASTDHSIQMVQEGFPQVCLVENNENVGFARANNQAIRLSAGRYILLLNSDTIVKPGAIDALIDFMNAHPNAGACGARLLNQNGSLQFSCSPEPTLGSEFKRLFHVPGVRPDGYYPMDFWDQSIPHQVDVILGACLLLRRHTLDKVGLMDEEYFIYSEEVDLCKRIRIAGWKLYWVPQGEVIHLGGQSTRQVPEAMFLRLYQAKLIYFRKRHGRGQAILYKLIIMTAALFRIMLVPFAWLEQPLKRQALLSMTRNYKRLLLALPSL